MSESKSRLVVPSDIVNHIWKVTGVEGKEAEDFFKAIGVEGKEAKNFVVRLFLALGERCIDWWAKDPRGKIIFRKSDGSEDVILDPENLADVFE